MTNFLSTLLAWGTILVLWEVWKCVAERRQKMRDRQAVFGVGDFCSLMLNDESRKNVVDAFDRAEDGGIGIFYANEKRYCIHIQPWIGKPYENGGTGIFR